MKRPKPTVCVCVLEQRAFNRPRPLLCWVCKSAQRANALRRLPKGTQLQLQGVV